MRIDLLLQEQLNYSRRQVKQAFQNKEIKINDKIVTNRSFSIDGSIHTLYVGTKKLIVPKHDYYMLNKPKGVVTANYDAKHQTIIDLIEENVQNLFSIGRLDCNTTGLILITNNGPLGYYLTQDKFIVHKKYFVKVNRELTEELITLFHHGVIFDDGYQCKSSKLKILTSRTAFLTIAEGKRHQIKKMFLSVGYYVEELHRMQIGSLKLDSKLNYGEYRKLDVKEIKDLYFSYSLKEGIVDDKSI